MGARQPTASVACRGARIYSAGEVRAAGAVRSAKVSLSGVLSP